MGLIIILDPETQTQELVKNLSNNSITILDKTASYEIIKNISSNNIESNEVYFAFSDSRIVKTSDNDFITFL